MNAASQLAGEYARIANLYTRSWDRTLYVSELDPRVNEEILAELFIQCAQISNVHLPVDKLSRSHQGFGFVELKKVEDTDYCIKVLNFVKLFGKSIRINRAQPASHEIKEVNDELAYIYVGNLDDSVDDRILNEIFGQFGIVRELKTSDRKFAIIAYAKFSEADHAILAMNGQYLGGRPVRVAYANTHKGESTGTALNRLLAELKDKL